MRKDVAKKWIKALRSGKYKKGEGYLKQYTKKGEIRYCCLGVLCELYNDAMKKNHKKTPKITRKKSDLNNNGFVMFNNKAQSLPVAVRKWAGIKDETGEFTYKVKYMDYEYEDNQNLSIMNDTGCKFTTIAKTIEQNIDNI